MISKKFSYLKLNIVFDKIVNFLDLKLKLDFKFFKISYDFFICSFKTELFVKPTNSITYLMTNSNHPKHIFDNVPIYLFIRIRRICSNFIDFLSSATDCINLLSKGYNFKKLSEISREIAKLDRKSLLPYKENIDKIFNSSKLKLFMKFDVNFSNFNNCIKNSYSNLDFDFLKHKKILIVNTINTNIGSILIHNIKTSFESKKCNCEKCKICSFLETAYFINYKKIFIPIMSLSNCNYKGVVYIIKCVKCNLFYI